MQKSVFCLLFVMTFLIGYFWDRKSDSSNQDQLADYYTAGYHAAMEQNAADLFTNDEKTYESGWVDGYHTAMDQTDKEKCTRGW